MPLLLLSAFMFLFPPLTIMADELSISANVDRSLIYQGESIILTVMVSGMDNPPEPDTSKIINCNIKYLGSQSESRHNITIVNGVVTKSGFSGRKFVYEITPEQTGPFITGPILLTANGQTLSQQGPTIDVVGIEKQNFVRISVEASRQSVMVDEPFEITLYILIRQMQGSYANADPIDPNNPPNLKIPYLNMQQPIPGLENPDVAGLLQKAFVNQSNMPGFSINDYKAQAGNLFFPQEIIAKFMFVRRLIQKDNQPFFEYTIKMKYVPQEEGSYIFGPVIFKGTIGISADPAGRMTGQPVFAVGPACTVRVVPPSEEDRPESYIGAIGSSLDATASLDAQICKVGDPLTLTLAISGDIRLNNIYPPTLNEQPNLTRNFKIYEDTIKTGGDNTTSKEFIYTIRPITAGTLEFPPINISYFNINERCYKTIQTQPIPIRADESEEIATDIIIETATNLTSKTDGINNPQVLPPAPIDINPAGAMPQNINPGKPHAAAVLFGPFLYLIAITSHALIKIRSRNAQKNFLRSTVTDSIKQIEHAGKISSSDPETARRILCSALKKYAGARFNTPESGLTPSDIHNLFKRDSINDNLTTGFLSVLERNFNAGFSHPARQQTGDLQSDCRASAQLIRDIEQAFRIKMQNKNNTGGFTALFLFLIAIPLCVYASAQNKFNEYEFAWNQANAQMASARTETDFMNAAQTYRNLVNAGVRNGRLFYNLGTACLMAGQYDEAITFLLRSERYTGTSWDIKRNMLIALARGDKNARVSLPWHRVPLFWHYQLSTPARTIITIAAFNIFWLMLIPAAFGLKKTLKSIQVLAVAVFVIFGSSSITSMHREDLDRKSEIIQKEIMNNISTQNTNP